MACRSQIPHILFMRCNFVSLRSERHESQSRQFAVLFGEIKTTAHKWHRQYGEKGVQKKYDRSRKYHPQKVATALTQPVAATVFSADPNIDMPAIRVPRNTSHCSKLIADRAATAYPAQDPPEHCHYGSSKYPP